VPSVSLVPRTPAGTGVRPVLAQLWPGRRWLMKGGCGERTWAPEPVAVSPYGTAVAAGHSCPLCHERAVVARSGPTGGLA
jgi:hypothetical protein